MDRDAWAERAGRQRPPTLLLRRQPVAWCSCQHILRAASPSIFSSSLLDTHLAHEQLVDQAVAPAAGVHRSGARSALRRAPARVFVIKGRRVECAVVGRIGGCWLLLTRKTACTESNYWSEVRAMDSNHHVATGKGAALSHAPQQHARASTQLEAPPSYQFARVRLAPGEGARGSCGSGYF